MHKIGFYILIIAICLLSSCGRRTEPKPYPPLPPLLPVENPAFFFKGKDLNITWSQPKLPKIKKGEGEQYQARRVLRYDLLFQKTNPECALCSPFELGKITFDTKTLKSKIYNRENDRIFENRFLIIEKDEKNFRIELLSDLLPAQKSDQNYALVIRYYTDSDQISPESNPIIPIKPRAFPNIHFETQLFQFIDFSNPAVEKMIWEPFRPKKQLDKIEPSRFGPLMIPYSQMKAWVLTAKSKEQWYSDEPVCFEPVISSFLLINWSPPLEIIQHTIAVNNARLERNVYYGVRFYQKMDFGLYKPLTDESIFSGRYDLPTSNHPIYARIVDRFNNESKRIFLWE